MELKRENKECEVGMEESRCEVQESCFVATKIVEFPELTIGIHC